MRKLENRLKKLERAEVAIIGGTGFEKSLKDSKPRMRLIETDKALEDARFG